MLCAARAEVGPLSQSFWVLWDRARGEQLSHTVLRPGSREVRMDGDRVVIDAAGLRAELRLGAAVPIEAICPSGPGWGWTRKAAGVPIEATVELPGRRLALSGFGVDDQSAGYQARRTSWHWSAGVGRAADGRALAWNLVEGINDPPSSSERAIWIDGEPYEPDPVRFDGLAAVASPDFCHPQGYKSRGERRAGGGWSSPPSRCGLGTRTTCCCAPPTGIGSGPSAAASTGSSWPRASASWSPTTRSGSRPGPARLTRCRRSGGAPRAGRGRRRRACGRSGRGSRPGR